MRKVKIFVGISLLLFFVSVTSLFTAALINYKASQKTGFNSVESNSNSNSNNDNSGRIVVGGVDLTLDTVAKHNNPADCWLVIDNKVYNVTGFLNSHPGGAEQIIKYCGKDGTLAFATKDKSTATNHSKMAHDLLAQYYIGDLGQQLKAVPSSVPTGTKSGNTANILPSLIPTLPGSTNQNGVTNSGLSLTSAEVGTHNTLQNCWMIISGKVYDLTTFIFQHPGGVTAISNYCGKDGTAGFNTKDKSPGSNHSNYAYSLLNNYLIGNLGTTVAVNPTQVPTAIPMATLVPTNVPGGANPTTTPLPTSTPSLVLSSAEVATHNTLQNCWLIISGKVYNVTSYISQHPGGAQMILNWCGKDGTTAFATKGGTGSTHSGTANNLLNNYLIGTLGSSVPTNPTATPTLIPGAPTNTPAPASTTTPVPACFNMPSAVCTKYPGATRKSGGYEDNGSWEGEANTPSSGCRHIKTNSSGSISSDQSC